MPGMDRSGPMGVGPMTGGQRGLCRRASNRDGSPNYLGPDYERRLGMRRGFRRGNGAPRGRGRGFGRGIGGYPSAYAGSPPMSETDEREMLKADAAYMKSSLEAINKRIEAMGNKAPGSFADDA